MIATFEELCHLIGEKEEGILDEGVLAACVLGLIGNQGIALGSRNVAYAIKTVSLIASNVLGYPCSIVYCSATTTWKGVAQQLTESGIIPHVVVFANLNNASNHVQSCVLNFLDTQRISLQNKIYETHEIFLCASIISDESYNDEINIHLKQRFLLWHTVEMADETTLPPPQQQCIVGREFFKVLRRSASELTVTVDVKRYMHDIVIFLRTHRLVRGGVSTKACKDLDITVRALAVLQNYTFATPSIVAMASRKVFPLKIEICQPQDEPTLHYGGDVNIVTKWMKKWDRDLVIDDVLHRVDPPI